MQLCKSGKPGNCPEPYRFYYFYFCIFNLISYYLLFVISIFLFIIIDNKRLLVLSKFYRGLSKPSDSAGSIVIYQFRHDTLKIINLL